MQSEEAVEPHLIDSCIISDCFPNLQITCRDPHHEWDHMVDVEVAARDLSKTVPFNQDARRTRKTQQRAAAASKHGYMRLNFAARGRLLKGPPLTRRLQSMAAGEDPAINDITIWSRIVFSLLKPGSHFGDVAFEASRLERVTSLEAGNAHLVHSLSIGIGDDLHLVSSSSRSMRNQREDGIELSSAPSGQGEETKAACLVMAPPSPTVPSAASSVPAEPTEGSSMVNTALWLANMRRRSNSEELEVAV